MGVSCTISAGGPVHGWQLQTGVGITGLGVWTLQPEKQTVF